MRHLFIVIVLILVSGTTKATNNPEEWFGSQYDDAIEFCKENKSTIASVLSDCYLPTDMVLSIAFPEMLRYSLWKDLLETKALELLYVSKGKEAADFSIGWMQMKPSFAEQVETRISNDAELNKKYISLLYNNSLTSSRAVREERVARLKDFKWQLLYLSAFTDINTQKLLNNNIPISEIIYYLAAAYNHGMDNDLQELSNFKSIKTFPYGYGRDNPFGYVEVSKYFYYNNSISLFSGI